MTIITKRFQNAKGAISYLEGLAYGTNDTIVFRGHEKESYRLNNTWQRHTSRSHEPWSSDIDEALTAYKVGLEKLGIKSFDNHNRFEAMEHARHNGVPTPCLDFSYSPYVALFFAFNDIRVSRPNNSYSVIYGLNINQLAIARAKELQGFKSDNDLFGKIFHEFQWPQKEFFENGFIADTLQFIPFPGSHNKRMQRQLGCLLYDTIHYGSRGLVDLDDYLAKIVEQLDEATNKPNEPILTRVLINHKVVGDVLARLELMNVTGGNLYDSAEGVALDIKNAYNYNPKFSYLRDVNSPIIDDTKM